jgi:acetate CoA/acetoacetate CoA-transferase alpha subunit
VLCALKNSWHKKMCVQIYNFVRRIIVMKSKLCSREQIINLFKDGQSIAIGGFARCGIPHNLIQCVLDSGVRHLTLICNDTGEGGDGIGRLIHSRQVDKVIVSHIGTNPETVKLFQAGEIEVELNPQGTLAERIRCGGMGLGGVLTKTGLGTIVQNRRQTITVDGQTYILEPALKADVSLTRARRTDPIGNLAYHGTCQNFNPLVVTNGSVSIVEADFHLELNELTIDEIMTPGVFVDMILEQGALYGC